MMLVGDVSLIWVVVIDNQRLRDIFPVLRTPMHPPRPLLALTPLPLPSRLGTPFVMIFTSLSAVDGIVMNVLNSLW